MYLEPHKIGGTRSIRVIVSGLHVASMLYGSH
jgi:hypothetical protein